MKKLPIFYNALLLTGVNLLLRFVSTSYQVFISGCIGASGVGLLQLVLSVASMTMTAGMAGIRTATMYLTAEELGKGRSQNVTWVLSACFGYSLLFSCSVGGLVYGFAPQIATLWIGDLRTIGAIRLFASFLPVSCFVGVMVGYFTAANRITTLAAVEVAEQICSIVVTTAVLLFWAKGDIGRACQSVVLGSCAGSLLTLLCLLILRLRERSPMGSRVGFARRLADTALPLAVADDVKVGITTMENLMVPKRLALYTSDAMAQFGIVCGMVFPVLMFPAALLYGLADLLIPELARCKAAGSHHRIRYLVRRSLRVALLYGLACCGVLFALSEALCLRLYDNVLAGKYLGLYALLIPMLYSDAIIDAVNKGLGQQKICVRINIFTAALDVAGLYILLPRWGMDGYFVSFFVSHAVNMALSLALLLKHTNMRISVRIPAWTMLALLIGITFSQMVKIPAVKVVIFLFLVFSLLRIWDVVHGEDLQWLQSLVGIEKSSKKTKIVFDK